MTQTHEHPHPHDHDHGHDHSHAGPGSYAALGPEGAPPKGGPVVVDIGSDVGALIAHMNPDLLGAELFLRPDREPSTTTHTGIWERQMGPRAAVVAVFPALLAGGYDILDTSGGRAGRVEVVGGEVGEIDLRTG
jgi:hypothetical protein